MLRSAALSLPHVSSGCVLDHCPSLSKLNSDLVLLVAQSVYKAISSQKDLHTVDFRQEDITDPQLIALAETLAEIPIMSSLDLRDNRITDDVSHLATPL